MDDKKESEKDLDKAGSPSKSKEEDIKASSHEKEQDEDPADIAFPTELRRHQSTPGAFPQAGINQRNNEPDHNNDEQDDDIDMEAPPPETACADIEGPLISAHLVEDDEIKPSVVAHAEPLPQTRKYRICYLCMALAGIIALAVGLSLALTSKKKKNDDNNTTTSLEKSFADLWQRAQFQSNHAVLWGRHSNCQNTTATLPFLNLSCPESMRVESTLNSTCQRHDVNRVTCNMNINSDNAGVLFTCAGKREHLLTATAHLLPTTATNCPNEDSFKASLVTFMSLSRFCLDDRPPKRNGDRPPPLDGGGDRWKECSNHTCEQGQQLDLELQQDVKYGGQTVCYDLSSCTDDHDCESLSSSTVQMSDPDRRKRPCAYLKDHGPGVVKMWTLLTELQNRDGFLGQLQQPEQDYDEDD